MQKYLEWYIQEKINYEECANVDALHLSEVLNESVDAYAYHLSEDQRDAEHRELHRFKEALVMMSKKQKQVTSFNQSSFDFIKICIELVSFVGVNNLVDSNEFNELLLRQKEHEFRELINHKQARNERDMSTRYSRLRMGIAKMTKQLTNFNEQKQK